VEVIEIIKEILSSFIQLLRSESPPYFVLSLIAMAAKGEKK